MGDNLVAFLNFGNGFSVGLFSFVEQPFSPEAVADITAAKMRADSAGIFEQIAEDIDIPFSIREVIRPIEILFAVIRDGFPRARSICPQNRLARGRVPFAQVFNRGCEVLKAEYIDIGIGSLYNLYREWCIGFVSVAEDQVVGIVAANRVVGDPVVARCHLEKFGSPGF